MLGPNIALSIFNSISGPIDQIQQNYFRNAVGWNDIAEARLLEYTQNWNAVLPPLPPPVGVGAIQLQPNRGVYQPVRLTVQQAIARFNAQDWTVQSQVVLDGYTSTLRADLQYCGVDLSAYGWQGLIDISSTPAPLDATIREWYRAPNDANADAAAAKTELEFQLRRAQMRRHEDRRLSLAPYWPWAAADTQALYWRGYIDRGTQQAARSAAGMAKSQDKDWADILAQLYPPPAELAAWDVSGLWSGDGVATFGLDSPGDPTGCGQFFSGIQGVGAAQTPLQDQPGGAVNWYQMLRRASRPKIDLGSVATMSWRFRDDGTGTGQSVVAGVPTWDAGTTQDALELLGYTPQQISWIAGLMIEPLSIRLVHSVLLETLKSPALAAQAAAAFAGKGDWVAAIFLDHGMSATTAALAAAAIRQQAWDAANEELLAAQKALRAESRANILAQYRLGVIAAVDAQQAIQDQYFGANEATAAIAGADQQVALGIAERQLASLKTAWMAGKVNAAQVATVLVGLGFQTPRINQYVTEWSWERTENAVMLSTSDLLSAVRAGVIAPPAALARLENLGWSAPDAMVELAIVDHAIQTAAAHATAAQAAAQQKQAAETAKALAEAAKVKAAAVAKAAAETAKQNILSLEGVHKKLMDTSEYFAKVHAANSAYRTAAKAGDTEKMQSELNKEIALYQNYLLQQQELVAQGPEVANAVLPIDTTVAPGPGPSAPAGPASGGYPPPPAAP